MDEQPRRRRRALALFAVLLIAIVSAGFIARSKTGESAAVTPTTTTTTSTTTSTTTTTVLPLDPGETRVATAKVPLVVASAQSPATLSPAIAKVSQDARATFASYSPERPDSKPIPDGPPPGRAVGAPTRAGSSRTPRRSATHSPSSSSRTRANG